MRASLAAALLLGAVAPGVGACDGERLSEVVVVFSAEEAVAARATRIEIQVWSEDSGRQVYGETYRLAGEGADATLPLRLPLTPADGDADRTYRVEARLFDGAGGTTPFATVRASAGYRRGARETLRLRFQDACADLVCDDGLTCWDGECRGACFAFGAEEDGEAGPVCSTCEACAKGACAERVDGATCSFDGHTCTGGACSNLGPFPQCALAPDADTLALYRMEAADNEAGVLRDATAAGRDGVFAAEGATVGGPDGCGDALAVGAPFYATIPDDADGDGDSDWALSSGSFELLVYFDALPPAPSGALMDSAGWAVLSRDRMGDLTGQFGLYLHSSGRFYVRLQEAVPAMASVEHVACSRIAVAGAWHHVAINFGDGGLEVIVDGQRGDFDGILEGVPTACRTQTELGIDMVADSWVVGGDSFCRGCPEPEQIRQHFEGAIDEFRISAVRRDFAREP